MAKVHKISDGNWTFHCPGCGDNHYIKTPRWSFNGDLEKPTVQPSISYRSGHFVDGQTKDDCWCAYDAEHPDDKSGFSCVICHSFVTDGQIQFLGDCTHALAGQTVDLVDWK